MTELLSTLPGGLVSGAVYALLAMGLVLIYKATRVPNFAYGAMATFIAFFHYQLVSGKDFGFSLDVLDRVDSRVMPVPLSHSPLEGL